MNIEMSNFIDKHDEHRRRGNYLATSLGKTILDTDANNELLLIKFFCHRVMVTTQVLNDNNIINKQHDYTVVYFLSHYPLI